MYGAATKLVDIGFCKTLPFLPESGAAGVHWRSGMHSNQHLNPLYHRVIIASIVASIIASTCEQVLHNLKFHTRLHATYTPVLRKSQHALGKQTSPLVTRHRTRK